MRFLSFFPAHCLLLWLCLFFISSSSDASIPVSVPIANVQVTLKGKKYSIDNVTTVKELQERLEEQSGIAPSAQGRLLFQGKSLTKSTAAVVLSLSEAGVSDGDVLNCVPKTSSSSSSSSSSKSSGSGSSSSSSSSKKKKSPAGSSKSTVAASTSSTAVSTADTSAKLQEMMQSAGVDTKAMEDMVNQMMGGGGGGGAGSNNMASMAESMEAMASMMKSPLLTQYLQDPEKLEQSRQMILQNPMLKSMMAGMPGMEELLNDPEAWAAAMKAAADMYTNMDQDDLMKAMMQGAEASAMGGMGGMPPGLFDGMNTGGGMGSLSSSSATASSASATPTALDELSEGEDE